MLVYSRLLLTVNVTQNVTEIATLALFCGLFGVLQFCHRVLDVGLGDLSRQLYLQWQSCLMPATPYDCRAMHFEGLSALLGKITSHFEDLWLRKKSTGLILITSEQLPLRI